ncbi:PRC-barrel domain-containing protein [Kitasatospora sp. NBC_01287]|uniref:PRC-barrel domain-containing protein n=1 Tax=Kitasatospora sp. NBC_01287 TaxID=2903573 RepID=UPI00225B573B|nr:PRC-barrel domain-containing protein [Kitasatospora sp. NBC_01287]MCX4744215.1 PRC-barrel domain-containing protein [Kitasatospora sp. NBC_01287]
MSGIEIWQFRTTSGHLAGADLVGYHVEATDGSIGKVDKHTREVDAEFLVVDTGPWLFGRHVLLPAGTVLRVDQEEQRIHVDRTKDEIRNGPEFEQDGHGPSGGYLEKYGAYYGPFYGGPVT